MRKVSALMIASLLLAGGCKLKQESDNPPGPTPSATVAATAAPSAVASAAAFDPASIAESTADLPPFPLLKPLAGLTNNLSDKDANVAFDREHFLVGANTISLEGKIFRGEYRLTGDRPYSSLEFMRNHEQAITQLGGVKVAGQVSTEPARRALQAKGEEPRGNCFIRPCDEADFYLLRQGGKEYWITVGTGNFPLHGYYTVLEKQGMAKSFAFMDAGALKSALDASGRVPVYIEFDVDRASLRPSARPAVGEIVKLMEANPPLRVSIEGHTDDTGTAARNQPLSLARAETVRAELIAAGIATTRMKTAGFGATRPLAQGTSEDARARNRRVELVKF
jgi:outer membrane protein OmpA-like peptidoglycan-associated protein